MSVSGKGLPLVSSILLCYNSEEFVAEALRGLLEQDYEGPMEIVISDDASKDQTVDVVEVTLGRRPTRHDVRLVRRETNTGSKSGHLNAVFPTVSGDILITFDDDDVSEPSRVRKIVERFKADPRTQAVFSSYSLIDPTGRPMGQGKVPHPPTPTHTHTHTYTPSRVWFATIDAYAAGTTLAVRRPVIDTFGPLDPAINEDVVLPFRASLLGEVQYISESLVRVRRRGTSLTADLDRFASLDAYRARIFTGIERARKSAELRLRDIQRAEELGLLDRAALGELRRIVAASLSNAELSGRLMDSSLFTRVSGLFQLMRRGAYQEDLLQHIGITLAPQSYLRYKRRSIARRKL